MTFTSRSLRGKVPGEEARGCSPTAARDDFGKFHGGGSEPNPKLEALMRREEFVGNAQGNCISTPDQYFELVNTRKLPGGYSLRVVSEGLFSKKVNLLSPDSRVIMEGVAVIRGIPKRFEDPETGWNATYRDDLLGCGYTVRTMTRIPAPE